MIRSSRRLVLRALGPLALGAASLAQTPAPVAGTWEYLGGPGVSHGAVMSGEIAVDGSGGVYVSFKAMDSALKLAAVVRWEDGIGAWRQAGRQASVGNAWYNALAFDSEDTPFVVHRDYALGGRFNVRRLARQRWDDLGVAAAPEEAHYTRLAIGRGDQPVVVYQDRGAPVPDATSVQAYSPESGTWRFLGPRGFSGASADYQSIAMNGHGRVFVAFSDHAHGGRVSVFRYDPPHWTPVGQRGAASHVRGHNATIAIDDLDRVHVAYRNWHEGVYVRRFDGSQWVTVGGGAASEGDQPELESEHWRQWLSLDFDSEGLPYVAYQLFQTHQPVVRRFERGTGRWRPLGAVGFVPGRADYLTLAVGAADTPLVAFRDADHGDRLSVMRFRRAPAGE